jgi:hypothetical protein
MSREQDREPILQTELTVNGQTIELNEFVQGFMGKAVIGMLSSLRGVGNVRTVKLEISRSPE